MLPIGSDQRHIARIHPQENCFLEAVGTGAQNTNPLIGDLVPVTYRAIAKQSAAYRYIVDVRCDLGAIVDYASAEQDSARRPFTALCTSDKTPFGPLQSLDQTFGYNRPKFCSLIPHQPKKFGASYPAWVSRMIVRPRDHGRSAMPRIDDRDRKMKTREINGGR
ncbi:hypothetical protein SBA_ch1_27230 [Sphingomonas bisphenolicum]|uniref:Uncharacterized protein n=1 Tax=Sphingomonas bisphenolicum TaxID=296544 RepID=A0ABM7G3S8_9SPHN|nr:hypothetical protein SBA_ch1_27230 [Sphingomonas bisphenolicum]